MKWKPSVKTCGLAFWDILFALLCMCFCLYYDYMQGGWIKLGWFQPYRLVRLMLERKDGNKKVKNDHCQIFYVLVS
jgi:hypothetical protein